MKVSRSNELLNGIIRQISTDRLNKQSASYPEGPIHRSDRCLTRHDIGDISDDLE